MQSNFGCWTRAVSCLSSSTSSIPAAVRGGGPAGPSYARRAPTVSHRTDAIAQSNGASKAQQRVGPRKLSELRSHPELLEPPPALIPGLAYRGRITLLSAREKPGKSTLTAQAVAAMSSGARFLDAIIEPATVLWYAIDERIGDAILRFDAFHAEGDRVYICEDRPSPEQLRSDIERTGATVVVIDTLTELWSSNTESDRDANEVNRFLRPYVLVARACNVALVCCITRRRTAVSFAVAFNSARWSTCC